MIKLRQVKRVQRNVIRVFLSSTFRDMAKEREYLNKVIFPEVRQATRERGVEFSAIDLRWGVTGIGKLSVLQNISVHLINNQTVSVIITLYNI